MKTCDRAWLASTLLVAAVSCTSSGDEAPRSIPLSGADTLVSAAADLLATPFDISVDERGSVYVLDYGNHRVLVVPPDGGAPRTIGSEGAGPGEFRGPSALAAGADTLRVLDRGNGRVQVLTADGAYVRSFSLGETNAGGEAVMVGSGLTAFGTGGIASEHLVTLLGPDGILRGGVGRLPAASVQTLDIAQMKSEIGQGRLPAVLRNRARPALSGEGGVWVVHQSDTRVERYDSAGGLVWDRRYEDPSTSEIREAFFERNRRDPRPFAFFPLTLVADAAAAGERLYLLLNRGEDATMVVLVVDGEGRVSGRLTAEDVRGARHVAVDPARRRLYVATAGAELIALPLPAGI
jgi:hypothetical protein